MRFRHCDASPLPGITRKSLSHTQSIMEVLEPIDVAARFGAEAGVGKVDEHVRGVMQTALGRLARQRRFPILG